MDQILLPGFEPAPQPKDRLFFAVLPDAAACAQIQRLAQGLRAQHQLLGRTLDAGRLHVSLEGLGDYPAMPHALVARAGQAAATVQLAPFQVRFDQALSFSGKARSAGRRAFVLTGDDGVAGLAQLHQALTRAMHGAGLVQTSASITPHLTMLYDGASVAAQAVEPVEWTVREFVLVHSLIGANLPYTILQRWPLA
jgi:2'-5' RNA ligase